MIIHFIQRASWAAGAWSICLLSPPLSGDEEQISFNEIAAIHRDVIVPIPSEIFSVLDQFKINRSDWRTQLKVPDEIDCQNRTHFALFLGRIVAEGFLAVEAQDKEAIRSLGRSVLSVSEELGLRDAIIKHSKSIIDEADRGDWAAVRAEFDATRQTVRETMNRRRDQDLAHCVSVGGWIRGTEIVTALIQRRYSSEASEILHQPELLAHFLATFNKGPSFKRDARLREITTRLQQLKPLMASDSGFPRDQVEKIHALCQGLRLATLSP